MMNKALWFILGLVGGCAVGAFANSQISKNNFVKERQGLIEHYETLLSKKDEEPVSVDEEQNNITGEEVTNSSDVKVEYEKITHQYNLFDNSELFGIERPTSMSILANEEAKEIMAKNIRGYIEPERISIEAFRNSSSKAMLTYYKDGIITDEDEDVVTVENTIGRTVYEEFLEEHEDEIGAYNPNNKVSYWMCADDRNYSDVVMEDDY